MKTPDRAQRLTMAMVVAAATMAMLLPLAGCNTVKGVGQDIQAAGQAGQDVITGDTDAKHEE